MPDAATETVAVCSLTDLSLHGSGGGAEAAQNACRVGTMGRVVLGP